MIAGGGALVAFVVAAIQEKDNAETLWIGAGVSAGILLIAGLGWLLTRPEHPVNGSAQSVVNSPAAVSQTISNIAAQGDVHISQHVQQINIPPAAVVIVQSPSGALPPFSLPVSKPLYITCNYRKTHGAVGGAYVGLKLNGVVVIDPQRVTSTIDQDEEGFASWEVGSGSVNGARTARMEWATKDYQGQAEGTGTGLGGPANEVTITGRVDDARITLGVSNVYVYSLP